MPALDAIAQLNGALAGRYTVDREIGAGGMATVYLARDVKHNRRVALKVLKPELGAVLGVERFLSEIQVTANLQHPNLLPLFDSGEANGLLFYVMPFIEGESLRARLDREKQLPVDDAVRIAVAVASALDYAHQHGVIHRDLKPENILLQAGQPVIADFGIALAVSNAGGARITQTGLSLGTPQYMSPEQATSDRTVDGRTDIYSLGAVTYEMLTGEPPHTGSTAQAIIARVLTERPRSARSSRPSVPPWVETAVECALEKLPADRFATAHDFAEALQGRASAAATPGSGRLVGDAARGRGSRVPAFLSSPFWAAAFALAALTALWEWRSRPREEAGVAVRFPLTLPAGTRIPPNARHGHAVAISPDGTHIVFAGLVPAGSVLFVRSADQLAAHLLPGTEGAAMPFFSPDGGWIGFFVGPLLKKVSLDGGAVVPVADLGTAPHGGSWTRDGRIVMAVQAKLAVVPASGGAVRLIAPNDSVAFPLRWPLALSDGKTVLVASWRGSIRSTRLEAVSLESGRKLNFDLPGNSPLGVIDGKLIYANGAGALMAVPFDERRVRAGGAPAPVLDQVSIGATGASRAALSPSGSLVYQTGGFAQQVVLAGATGATRLLIPQTRDYAQPRFSPDGRRIALAVGSGTSTDIHVYEIAAGTLTRLTTEGTSNDRPEWTPDGRRVLFRSDRTPNGNSLWLQPVDGSGPAERIPGIKADVWEGVISPDGNTLLYRTGTIGLADLWTRQLKGDTTARPFVQTPFTEWEAQFSPDGRWVAYASDESGTYQVYVKPFPGLGARVLVSVNGGDSPLWSRDGRRLFYVRDQQVIAADVTLSPTFAVTTQRTFLEGDFAFGQGHASYDVTPDGRELLLLKPVGNDSPLIVAHGWRHEVRARLAEHPAK